MNTFRINALLSIEHFDIAFKSAFSKSKSTSQNIISSSRLAKTIFSLNKDRLSEAECELLAEKGFSFVDFKKELSSVSSECLEIINSTFYVKPQKYKVWRKIVFVNGQDIFMCALDDKCFSNSEEYIVQMNSPSLNKALKHGYAENHCHYNVAGPAFYYNWLFLHNGSPFDGPLKRLKRQKNDILKYYTEADFNRFYNLCILAIYLRRFLYFRFMLKDIISLCNIADLNISLSSFDNSNPKFEIAFFNEIESLPVSNHSRGDDVFDYCCSSKRKNQIFGERELLCSCFDGFDSSPSNVQASFILYLIVRRHIESFFVQNNMWYGFNNFKRFERIFDLLVPSNDKTKAKIGEWISSYLSQDKNLKKLEVRFAPKANFNDTLKRSKLCKKSFDKKDKPKLGLVLHFIKKSRDLSNSDLASFRVTEPRSWDDIKQYEQQLSIFKRMMSYKKTDSLQFVGVDAANEEIRCRPEVFAPFYRAIREYSSLLPKNNQTIGYTYHVGEDFTFIVNGLRAISEAIYYLELKDGDRLGHASALATNVDKYFTLKGKTFVSTKQEALDDYCYIFNLINHESSFYNLAPIIKAEIEKLIFDVYGNCSFESYMHSLYLRGDHPSVFRYLQINRTHEEEMISRKTENKGFYLRNDKDIFYDTAWKDPLAKWYIHQYHFSDSVRKKGDEIFTRKIEEDYIKAIKFAQEKLAETISSKGIGIETNPSSNYLIGPFENFEDIPAVCLDSGDLAKYRLMISVGTDDPALFFTNLRNEYSSLFYYYLDSQKMAMADIIYRIEQLADRSLQLSFIKD